ncbi:MAG TPA: hypothetical protein VEI83_00870 [Acidimicrobiales bacterium]|nr:hypothetical protein [Acidimicrobiales bacterium]
MVVLSDDTEVLRIEPWPDPVIDALGHDPRSWYVERFWLAVLGPTSTWLLRRIAAGFDTSPEGFDLPVDEAARALGLGGRTGRHSPFQRAVARCVTFELALSRGPATIGVRRHVPPLPRRHLVRLPPSLQEHHRRWNAAHQPAAVTDRRRGRTSGPAPGPSPVTAASPLGNTPFTSAPYPLRVATYLLRVEVPDRPGALGAVASRIGAVRADVIAVDIVGRAQGRAVDEFVVELADDDHVPLMLSEIAEVDGIKVEALHPLPDGYRDGRLDSYETAVALLRERTPHGALNAIAARSRRELDGAWSAVLDSQEATIVASSGRPPAAHWLAAYVESARRAAAGGHEEEAGASSPGRARPGAEQGGEQADIAWVDLAAWDLVLLVGRPVRPLGRYDRLRLAAIARVADARWADLAERDARLSHPSRLAPVPAPPAPAPSQSPAPAP